MAEQKIEIYRDRLYEGFNGKTCRINPVIIRDRKDRAFVIHTILSLSGADVFSGLEIASSRDGGLTFSEPRPLKTYEKHENGIRTVFGIDTSIYHKNTDTWLCFGRTTHYENDKHPILIGGIAPCEPYFVLLDPITMEISPISAIPMPFETISAVPFGQPIISGDGNILMTYYCVIPGDRRARVVSVLYSFDGEKLTLIKSGTPLISGPEHLRGYDEPSIAYLSGKYYMTIRTDEVALLSVSDDGFDFSEPIAWCFDEGEEIGCKNTQQRWIRFDDALYLAYTRKTQYNGHVFRNRAPLFISRFDPERLCLIKETERILVPELGARLGNFQVTDVSGDEAWVTVAEWMQQGGQKTDEWKTCARYGSNNTVWRIRVTKN